MINDKFLGVICCPSCKADLKLREDVLVCKGCRTKYHIIEGIPILLPKLGEDVLFSLSKWTSKYKRIDCIKQFYVYKEKYMDDTVRQINLHYTSKKHDLYLEIGCGPAFLGTHFAREGLDVYGIDISLDILRITKKFYDDLGLECFLVCGDINYMPFKDNLFGLIYGGGVIEHFKSTELVLSETNRVLKRDGVCFNTVPYLNLGALTYRQRWGNIPNLPILKHFAEFVHIRLLRGKYMQFGYELSFTRKQLEHLYRKAGYCNISTHKFVVDLSLEYLPDGILRRIAHYLAENSQLFWPMIYIAGEKKNSFK